MSIDIVEEMLFYSILGALCTKLRKKERVPRPWPTSKPTLALPLRRKLYYCILNRRLHFVCVIGQGESTLVTRTAKSTRPTISPKIFTGIELKWARKKK